MRLSPKEMQRFGSLPHNLRQSEMYHLCYWGMSRLNMP